MSKISVQLYSCKDATAVDFVGTLEKIASIGYDGVEFAGYGGLDAQEMKAHLDRLGLKASGAHIGLDELKNNLEYHIEFNKTVGNKYLICPWAKVESKEDALQLKADFAEVAKRLEGTGMVFGFHNHAVEFQVFDGEYAMDIMLSGHEDEIYEPDCFWTEYAGVDTCAYLEKIGPRTPLVHLKDMRIEPDGSKESSIFGEGILDNQKIVDAAKKYCNPEWFVIEWEAFDMDCIEAVKRSYDNLVKMI